MIVRSITELFAWLAKYPSVWPALFFPFVLPLLMVALRSRRARLWLRGHRRRVILTGAVGCLALYLLTTATYLTSGIFYDFFEPRESSVAAVFLRGGTLYPGPESAERYASPYGPVLYLAVALSQALFGPSVFAGKLPAIAAALLAIAVFAKATQRLGAGRRPAIVYSGLLAALLLAFRYASFWAKSDGLILLCVTGGLYAASIETTGGALLLGVCIGVAINLKLHAMAYFLPALVIAHHRGWTLPRFAVAALVATSMAALPFIVAPHQISLHGYVEYLLLTAQEGFDSSTTFGFVRWVVLLSAMALLGHRLVKFSPALTRRELDHRRALWGSLALAAILVAVPGCAVGAGQGHLMPLIPSFILVACGIFPGGRRAYWDRTRNVFWQAAVASSMAACGMVSMVTAWRVVDWSRSSHGDALVRQGEISAVLRAYPQVAVLFGAGSDAGAIGLHLRSRTVLAGNPIGLDPAAMMDYQQAGRAAPSLAELQAQVRREYGREIVWLVPVGSAPFSQTNLYDGRQAVYPLQFRQDFARLYYFGRRLRCFDLYLPSGAVQNTGLTSGVLPVD